MKAQKNASLIIGIAIPIAMVLFVAVSIYLPGMFIKPTVNFLYMSGNNDSYSCENVFEVHDGTLMSVPSREILGDPKFVKRQCLPVFYTHDVATNESKEVTLEEAQKLKLDASVVSSDGFELVRGGRSGDFLDLFGSSNDYNTMYLKGHNISRKVDLKKSSTNEYSYYDYQFLGWILP